MRSYHNIPPFSPPDHVQESVEGEAAYEESHQQDFENGKIDYNGQDSFENIQAHLDLILKS